MSPATHFDAWLGELTFGLVDYFDRDRSLRTVRLLESIANYLYRLPGRKNLIWVSGSFPDWILTNTSFWKIKPGSTKTNLKREIERAIRALSDANLAIYPVDARGLNGLLQSVVGLSVLGIKPLGLTAVILLLVFWFSAFFVFSSFVRRQNAPSVP